MRNVLNFKYKIKTNDIINIVDLSDIKKISQIYQSYQVWKFDIHYFSVDKHISIFFDISKGNVNEIKEELIKIKEQLENKLDNYLKM